jgi:FAD/FMN-containing dehydrogenase
MTAAGAPDELTSVLRQIVGAEHLLTDPDLRAGYEVDWTRRFHGPCDAVVRPADTGEVAAVLGACTAAGAVVIPQGGNTGLVGGSVPGPAQGGRRVVVLSTRRLRAIGPIDDVVGQVTVGAGVTLAELEEAVAVTPWRVGVDLGARESATIGGMVATNAGGTRVVRHGMMRDNVGGVEAVLADGTVLSHLGGLLKDNTGYDIASLLCGSEGTLAVLTAVRMRLVPKDDERCVAWIGCGSWNDAVAVATSCRLRLRSLDGIEAVDAAAQRVVAEALQLSPPVEGTIGLLVALTVDGGPQLDTLAALAGERPVAVALDGPGASSLWERRDRVTEAIATTGVPHKLDVSVPLPAIPPFTAALPAVVTAAAPGAAVYVFGHLGDGNLHVNVVGPAPEEDAVDDAILRLVAANGGSISAEHGIGRAKQRWLHLSRSPEELRTFRAIKAALDPAGTLNPGAGPVLP